MIDSRDLDELVQSRAQKSREVETTNKIIEMLGEFDLDAAERILSYVTSRIEMEWYD